MPTRLAGIAALLLLGTAPVIAGESLWVQIAQLYGSDTNSNDSFGHSFSVDGHTLVVGAYNNGTGAAYVFERLPGAPTRWQETKKLTPSAAGDTDFGQLVSISGNTIMVRATSRLKDRAGEIYMYERDAGGPGAWGLVQRFGIPGGNGAALDGDSFAQGYVFIDVDPHGAAGGVFMFEREPDGPGDWHYSTTLTASDARAQDFFGDAVSLFGDRLLVGADQVDDLGLNAGAAYVFDRDETGEWVESVKLLASDGTNTDYFGSAVGLDGDTAVIGTRADGGDQAAYIFERDPLEGWLEAKILQPSDGALTDPFGEAVAISRFVAVVGSWHHDLPEVDDGGAAYVYERDHGGDQAWGEIAKVNALHPASFDNFGRQVDIDRNTIVVGARHDDDRGFDAGSVYLFSRTKPLLSIRGSCPGKLEVTVIGTTPAGRVVLLGAQSEGITPIPLGPCEGTGVNLDRPKVLFVGTATSGGDLTLTPVGGQATCGRYLQAVDVATCVTSDVRQIP